MGCFCYNWFGIIFLCEIVGIISCRFIDYENRKQLSLMFVKASFPLQISVVLFLMFYVDMLKFSLWWNDFWHNFLMKFKLLRYIWYLGCNEKEN